MKFETRRQIFHLVFGNILAILVLVLQEKALYFIGACLFIGVAISKAMQQKMRIPVFDWFINNFERETHLPGKGLLHFFLGTFVSLVFFDSSIVFLAVLVLAYSDSFATIVGKGFGRIKIWNDKTLEGSLAALAAGFFICAFYLPLLTALLVAVTAALAELFAPVDDNLLIPPFAGLVIYILT